MSPSKRRTVAHSKLGKCLELRISNHFVVDTFSVRCSMFGVRCFITRSSPPPLWLSPCLTLQAWPCRIFVQKTLRGERPVFSPILPCPRPVSAHFMDTVSVTQVPSATPLPQTRTTHHPTRPLEIFVSQTLTIVRPSIPTR